MSTIPLPNCFKYLEPHQMGYSFKGTFRKPKTNKGYEFSFPSLNKKNYFGKHSYTEEKVPFTPFSQQNFPPPP